MDIGVCCIDYFFATIFTLTEKIFYLNLLLNLTKKYALHEHKNCCDLAIVFFKLKTSIFRSVMKNLSIGFLCD